MDQCLLFSKNDLLKCDEYVDQPSFKNSLAKTAIPVFYTTPDQLVSAAKHAQLPPIAVLNGCAVVVGIRQVGKTERRKTYLTYRYF